MSYHRLCLDGTQHLAEEYIAEDIIQKCSLLLVYKEVCFMASRINLYSLETLMYKQLPLSGDHSVEFDFVVVFHFDFGTSLIDIVKYHETCTAVDCFEHVINQLVKYAVGRHFQFPS